MKSRRKKTSAQQQSAPEAKTSATETGEPSVKETLAAAGLKKSDRVLQVGYADGAVSLKVAQLTEYVTVVEQSSELVAIAQEKILERGTANLSVQQIEAGRLPFEDGTFDMVISWGRVHRYEDPPVIFTEMVRVLKSTGRLLVADILGAEDRTQREAHAKIEQIRYELPVTLCTAAELRALSSGAELEVVNQFQWIERMDFDEWMSGRRTDVSRREKAVRLFTGAAKKKTTELNIEIAGKNITFARRWMLIVAQKTGVT